MQRRRFLTAIVGVGAISTAGCGAISGSRSLTEPTKTSDAGNDWIERSASFEADGEEMASVGARATPIDDAIDLEIQLWHQTDTSVTDITHRVAMRDDEGQHAAEVFLGAPFAGDGDSPNVSLSPAKRRPGILIDVDDLGDLAHETINMKLRIDPRSNATGALILDSEVELDDGGLLGGAYTLDSELEFGYRELTK